MDTFTKPQDREVVCHASAWNIDAEEDIRIKMCTKVNATDFQTIYHELGHNYYQRAYNVQDITFRGGANSGFHEAIGDMIALSLTPDYLHEIGLLDEVPSTDGDLGLLMKMALEKVAFIPFGLLVDRWRWQVFSGETKPAEYNQSWWQLREKYQGVRPPVKRAAHHFDPGGKYHVPNNRSYTRYFLSHILQFQFFESACKLAGWPEDQPIHRCNIAGSKAAGEKFNDMLKLGRSQPWPQTLETFTGSQQIDASSVVRYFEPLMDYLEEQNADQICGW